MKNQTTGRNDWYKTAGAYDGNVGGSFCNDPCTCIFIILKGRKRT